MLELQDALEKVLDLLPPPVKEFVPLTEAAGRVLTGRITSSIDLPRFDNSAMDGYAVRASDVTNANPAAPVRLRVCARIPAGENFTGELAAGECVRLFTGSPVPRGADAVVMQEDTRTDAAKSDEVLVCDGAKPGENIRRAGDDVRRGAPLAEAGEILNYGKISLLAATGVGEVNVGKRPVVGLLATGSELREAGQRLAPGQIH